MSAEASTALTMLAHHDRRHLLDDLLREPSLSMFEATDIIANGSGRDMDQLELELLHVHLPKLVDAGYVHHDAETGAVHRGPKFDEIEPLLRLIDDHRDELPDGWF